MVLAAVVGIAACSGESASGSPTSGPGGSTSASIAAVSPPAVSMDGAKVHVAGVGNGTSPKFDLPAGDVDMSVSTCPSNGVIPFVWVYDASSSLAGIVTEASYHLQNPKGGMYYVLVSTNPDCQWTVDFAPK